jgi:bifunctional enzyme CysN/CysC/sulfate adenylyltransferase subunit 1
VVVLPAGIKTRVANIWNYDTPLDEAFCPQSVTLCLEHDIDISRGDMIVGLDNLPGRSAELHAQVCWMHSRPLQPGKKYFLKHATQTVQAIVTKLESRVNMTTLEAEADPAALAINDIGGVRLKTAKPLVFDGYTTNHLTGSFILIEQGTNATVAAGMLSAPTEAVTPEYTDFAI